MRFFLCFAFLSACLHRELSSCESCDGGTMFTLATTNISIPSKAISKRNGTCLMISVAKLPRFPMPGSRFKRSGIQPIPRSDGPVRSSESSSARERRMSLLGRSSIHGMIVRGSIPRSILRRSLKVRRQICKVHARDGIIGSSFD